MKKTRVTSLDIAKAAGVSQATVSRAFAGGRVAAPVRARILEIADSMNYRPNAVARSLTMGRSMLVGLIISDLTSLIYPELVYELTERLATRGYRVMLFTTSRSRTVESVLLEVRSHRLDGVISLALLSQQQCESLGRAELSVVLYNQISGPSISSVYCDHKEAGRRFAGALIEARYDPVAVVAGPEDSFVSAQFLESFSAALIAASVPFTVVHKPYDYAAGRQAARQLFEAVVPRPQCLVCVNDVVAAGALDCLRYDLDIAVPDEAAVFALNRRGASSWAGYELSALRQPTGQMADAAVEALTNRIEDPIRPAEHRVFFAAYHPGKTGALPFVS